MYIYTAYCTKTDTCRQRDITQIQNHNLIGAHCIFNEWSCHIFIMFLSIQKIFCTFYFLINKAITHLKIIQSNSLCIARYSNKVTENGLDLHFSDFIWKGYYHNSQNYKFICIFLICSNPLISFLKQKRT